MFCLKNNLHRLENSLCLVIHHNKQKTLIWFCYKSSVIVVPPGVEFFFLHTYAVLTVGHLTYIGRNWAFQETIISQKCDHLNFLLISFFFFFGHLGEVGQLPWLSRPKVLLLKYTFSSKKKKNIHKMISRNAKHRKIRAISEDDGSIVLFYYCSCQNKLDLNSTFLSLNVLPALEILAKYCHTAQVFEVQTMYRHYNLSLFYWWVHPLKMFISILKEYGLHEHRNANTETINLYVWGWRVLYTVQQNCFIYSILGE